jgi:hypothetical protein
VSEREKELEQALLGMKHRVMADGSPCWCLLWPDEEHEAEKLLSTLPPVGPEVGGHGAHGDHCLRARAALEPNPDDEVIRLRAENSRYLAGLTESHWHIMNGGAWSVVGSPENTLKKVERAIAAAVAQPPLTAPKSPIK